MLIDKFKKHFPRYYSNPFKHDELASFDYVDQSTVYQMIDGITTHVFYWFDADFDYRYYKQIVVKVYSIDPETNEPENEEYNFNGNIIMIDDINKISEVQPNYVGLCHDKKYRCGIFIDKKYIDKFIHVEYKSSGYSNYGKVTRIIENIDGEIELWSEKPSDENTLSGRTLSNVYDNTYMRDSYNPNNGISSNVKYINAMKKDHPSTCNETITKTSAINQQKYFHVVKQLSGTPYTINMGFMNVNHRHVQTSGRTGKYYVGTYNGYNTGQSPKSTVKSFNYDTSINNKPSNVYNNSEFISKKLELNYTIKNNYTGKFIYKNRIIPFIKDNSVFGLFAFNNGYFIYLNNNNNSFKYTDDIGFPYIPDTNINVTINWDVSSQSAHQNLSQEHVARDRSLGISQAGFYINVAPNIYSNANYSLNPDTYGLYNKSDNTYAMVNIKCLFIKL